MSSKKPFVSVVAVLGREDAPAARAVAQAIAAVREHVGHLSSQVDFILVSNGLEPDSLDHVRRAADEIDDLQVFVLADEVDADVAFFAGLENAIGDTMITLDLANFDGPLLGDMIQAAKCGNDIVVAQRAAPATGLYWMARRMFLNLYKNISGVDEARLSVQKALSRAAVNYITRHGDGAQLLRTLAVRSGFRTAYLNSSVEDRRPRSIGAAVSKGIRMMTSGTNRPLRLVSLLGLAGGSLNLLYMFYVLSVLLFKSSVAEGWTTMSLQFSGMFFLISVMLSLMAEYILQIHSRSLRNPSYYIAEEFRSNVFTREGQLNIEKSERAA